jgi:hypothetical protein
MAGMREAFLNKNGPFAKATDKSRIAPVVAAFSSKIPVAQNEELPMDGNRPGDFSFASIEDVLSKDDLTCIVNMHLSTLLDSGASSHIIKDMKYFWNYDRQGAKSVKTANHGTLTTLATGDCVAIVRCGKLSTRVTLRNCFHAPSAVINLLSVGKMVTAGFGCNFEGNKVVISAPHPNRQTLCEGPMLNNLFFLDIELLPAPLHNANIPCSHHFSKPPTTSSEPFAIIEEERVNFAKVPVDANLWHRAHGPHWRKHDHKHSAQHHWSFFPGWQRATEM